MTTLLSFAIALGSIWVPASEPPAHCAISTTSWCIYNGDNVVSMQTSNVRTWKITSDEIAFEVIENLNCDSVRNSDGKIVVAKKKVIRSKKSSLRYEYTILTYECTVKILWIGDRSVINRAQSVIESIIAIGLGEKFSLDSNFRQ